MRNYGEKGGAFHNLSGEWISDEELESMDPEAAYYIYLEEHLIGIEEHNRDTRYD